MLQHPHTLAVSVISNLFCICELIKKLDCISHLDDLNLTEIFDCGSL